MSTLLPKDYTRTLAIVGRFNDDRDPARMIRIFDNTDPNLPNLSAADVYDDLQPALGLGAAEQMSLDGTDARAKHVYYGRKFAPPGAGDDAMAITLDSVMVAPEMQSSAHGGQDYLQAGAAAALGGRVFVKILKDADRLARFETPNFSRGLLELTRRYLSRGPAIGCKHISRNTISYLYKYSQFTDAILLVLTAYSGDVPLALRHLRDVVSTIENCTIEQGDVLAEQVRVLRDDDLSRGAQSETWERILREGGRDTAWINDLAEDTAGKYRFEIGGDTACGPGLRDAYCLYMEHAESIQRILRSQIIRSHVFLWLLSKHHADPGQQPEEAYARGVENVDDRHWGESADVADERGNSSKKAAERTLLALAQDKELNDESIRLMQNIAESAIYSPIRGTYRNVSRTTRSHVMAESLSLMTQLTQSLAGPARDVIDAGVKFCEEEWKTLYHKLLTSLSAKIADNDGVPCADLKGEIEGWAKELDRRAADAPAEVRLVADALQASLSETLRAALLEALPAALSGIAQQLRKIADTVGDTDDIVDNDVKDNALRSLEKPLGDSAARYFFDVFYPMRKTLEATAGIASGLATRVHDLTGRRPRRSDENDRLALRIQPTAVLEKVSTVSTPSKENAVSGKKPRDRQEQPFETSSKSKRANPPRPVTVAVQAIPALLKEEIKESNLGGTIAFPDWRKREMATVRVDKHGWNIAIDMGAVAERRSSKAATEMLPKGEVRRADAQATTATTPAHVRAGASSGSDGEISVNDGTGAPSLRSSDNSARLGSLIVCLKKLNDNASPLHEYQLGALDLNGQVIAAIHDALADAGNGEDRDTPGDLDARLPEYGVFWQDLQQLYVRGGEYKWDDTRKSEFKRTALAWVVAKEMLGAPDKAIGFGDVDASDTILLTILAVRGIGNLGNAELEWPQPDKETTEMLDEGRLNLSRLVRCDNKDDGEAMIVNLHSYHENLCKSVKDVQGYCTDMADLAAIAEVMDPNTRLLIINATLAEYAKQCEKKTGKLNMSDYLCVGHHPSVLYLAHGAATDGENVADAWKTIFANMRSEYERPTIEHGTRSCPVVVAANRVAVTDCPFPVVHVADLKRHVVFGREAKVRDEEILEVPVSPSNKRVISIMAAVATIGFVRGDNAFGRFPDGMGGITREYTDLFQTWFGPGFLVGQPVVSLLRRLIMPNREERKNGRDGGDKQCRRFAAFVFSRWATIALMRESGKQRERIGFVALMEGSRLAGPHDDAVEVSDDEIDSRWQEILDTPSFDWEGYAGRIRFASNTATSNWALLSNQSKDTTLVDAETCGCLLKGEKLGQRGSPVPIEIPKATRQHFRFLKA